MDVEPCAAWHSLTFRRPPARRAGVLRRKTTDGRPLDGAAYISLFAATSQWNSVFVVPWTRSHPIVA